MGGYQAEDSGNCGNPASEDSGSPGDSGVQDERAPPASEDSSEDSSLMD